MSNPVPDLSKPYTPRERAYAAVVLFSYWQLIERLMSLADIPASLWRPELNVLFHGSAPGGIPEHPQGRLQRWLAVYSDEIRILRNIRNQIAQAADLSDPDLRGADYLARVILATLFGIKPTDVNEPWVTAQISTISRAFNQ